MIVSRLENSSRIESLHPLFKQLFDYVKTHDLLNAPLGRIELDGDNLFINNVNPECVPADKQVLEMHRDYIDVHILLTGQETIGWKAVETLEHQAQAYQKEGDCALYSDRPTLFATLQPGEFAIVYPEDPHAPVIGEGINRKSKTLKEIVMEKIIGLIDAPFTPFYENGEVNYEPIEAYCQLLVKNGLQGVFINGSSGEGYMLTEDERMKLAERWVEVAPQGFKVIVHVGSTCVKSSKRLAEHAQKIGAWGIGAMAPPFPNVGRIEELVKYCEEIACGAPELPFYFYHIPAFNGAFLSMVAFLEAVDGRIPNFAGIKYTFESMYEYNQCRLYKNGKFDMLHGQDETILPCLAMGGAQGGIGGTTNYNGKELVGIIEAWKAGDLELARERQNFAQEVINVICHYRGNIVGGKRIMKLIGLDLGKNRTPFQNMTDEEEAAMKKELEAINFFERCNKF